MTASQTFCLAPATTQHLRMDVEEFRERGKEMIDWICDHVQSLGDKNVLSQVEPGYLRPLIPADAPQEPEEWSEVMKGP